MFALTYKAKNYASVALKVGILFISFHYLYTKLIDQHAFWSPWEAKTATPSLTLALIGFLILSAGNWLLESKKWHLLVNTHTTLSFREARAQTLVSLVVSLPTPNRVGDYAAKAFFFPRGMRKRILLLNAVSSMSQMGVTCLFGVLGLLLWNNPLPLDIFNTLWVGFIILLVVMGIMAVTALITPSIGKILALNPLQLPFQSIPFRATIETIGYSLGRYVIFSTQFYLMLLFLGAEVSFWEGLAVIYLMYFFVSILPMFPFMDIVIKGSIGVWLFEMVGVSSELVLSTTLGIWIFNLVIPSILGSFHLIKAPN